MIRSRAPLILGMLIACFALDLSAQGIVDDDGSPLLDRARDALTRNAFGEVWELLEEPTRTNPGEFLPLYLEACRRAQRFERGRAMLEAIDLSGEGDVAAIIAMAQWEAEEGWVGRATARLEAALTAQPQAAVLWQARARLARSVGEAAVALLAADRAIAAGIDPLDLAWLRGEASIEIGEVEEGERILASLVKARPGHLGALLGLARLARGRGEYSTAIERCWQVLERDPDHVATLGELGTLLVRKQETRLDGMRLLERFRQGRDRRERIERLVRERREGRDAPELRIELARALRIDGRPAISLAVATDRIDGVEDPSLRSALLGEVGSALVALGERSSALRALGGAVALDRSRNDLRLEVVELLLEAGDVARASEVLERIGERGDPRRRAWATIDVLARRGAGWEPISEWLVRLLESDPTDPVAARAYVDAAIAFAKVEEARAFLGERVASSAPEDENAVPISPAHATAILALAWLRSETAPDDPWLTEAEVALRKTSGIDAWLWIADRSLRRGDREGAGQAQRFAARGRAIEGSRGHNAGE